MKDQMLVATEQKARLYNFEQGFAAFGGDREAMRESLGGKGAGLSEMIKSGVKVPPGLTILTTQCRAYTDNGGKMPDGLMDEVFAELAHIESALGRKLGDLTDPLLLSVRSGAKFSMPGMMDTILNLGMNDKTVVALAKSTGNERFAYDSYRRFIQMYGNVVLDINKDQFEDILDDLKDEAGIKSDADLGVDQLKKLIEQYKALVQKKTGAAFIQDTREQLAGAIEAVFRSWNNHRAVYYRNLHKIDHRLGTAVNVQAMVFGNYDDNSATGVCFTRNPSTGEKSSTANTSSKPRAKTSSPECALPSRSPRWRPRCPRYTRSCSPTSPGSKPTIATSRTSSLPSSRGASISCRRATANAPHRQQSKPQWI